MHIALLRHQLSSQTVIVKHHFIDRPGMSTGLEKEQRTLNQLMVNYRNLCTRLNQEVKRSIGTVGIYFTDMVSDIDGQLNATRLKIASDVHSVNDISAGIKSCGFGKAIIT